MPNHPGASHRHATTWNKRLTALSFFLLLVTPTLVPLASADDPLEGCDPNLYDYRTVTWDFGLEGPCLH